MFKGCYLAIWALQRGLPEQPLGQLWEPYLRPPQPDRLQIGVLLDQYLLRMGSK